MMGTILLESSAALLAVFAPLVAVPLGVITFYLRSIRETQVSRHAELIRKTELLEQAVDDLRRAVADVQRDFTNKEEWLRECMLARHSIDKLRERTARLDAMIFAVASDTRIIGGAARRSRQHPPDGPLADPSGDSGRRTKHAKRA